MRFREAVHAYLSRPGGVSGTQAYVSGKLMYRLGGKELERIDQNMIDEYVKIEHASSKPGTIRREMVVMQAIINNAARRGWCKAWKVEKPMVHDERERVLSDEEYERLKKVAPHDLLDLIVFILNTGARLGEAIGLRWQDVLLDEKGKPMAVVFRTRKARGGKTKKRTVPLNAVASEVVDSMIGRHKEFALVRADDEPWRDRCQVHRELTKACARAGITDLRMHDLRHTFASKLVAKGVPLRVVAGLLGHSTMQMVMRYSHLEPAHYESALARLDS